MGSWKRRLGGLLNVWANGAVPQIGRRREHWWVGAEEFEPRVMLAGTPTQVVFTTEPSNVALGATIQPSVVLTLEDAQGNPVTTGSEASAQVILTISAGPTGAQINGGRSVTISATNGVATFSNLTFGQQGMYTLTASAAGLPQGSLSTAFNVGPSATKLVFVQAPGSTTAGSTFPSVVVAVEDANGNLVTTDSSNVTLSINTGGGSLTGTTVQSTRNNNGEATFNGLSISKGGTYTLIATDGSLTNVISGQLVISAGAPAKLAFVQQPLNTPQSGVITPSVAVAVEDQFGNIVTTDSSQVSLIFGPGQSGVLNGTTAQSAVNGVATFNDLSIAQLGNFTLQASDGALTPATSAAFAVTGPPSKLAFQQQPSQAMINSSLSSFTVLVEDAGGNIVATDNSAVTLTIASNGPGGTISGTTTVNAVNGRATFTDISFNKVGTYTIDASDTDGASGVLQDVVSSPVLVYGPAAQLAFTIEPPGGAAASALSPAVTVSVEDAQGNLVANSNLPVTISLNNGTTNAVLTGTLTASAVNGVATFNNLIVSGPGTFTLSASGTGLTGAVSDSFIVEKSASLLHIATGPTDSAANAILAPIVIDIENDSLQTVTSNSSTVIVTFTGPPNASISGTTSVTAVKGVATFSNLSFSASGTYTLSFQDAGLTTVTAAPITISAAANKLVFSTQPSLSTASSAGIDTVVVSIVDQHGHLVTTDSSTVTLTAASAASSGTLTGTTSVVAVNGVATFSNLVLTGAGTYTLSAKDSSLAGANSSKFTVVPDIDGAHLVFSQTPASGSLVATKLTPVMTVAVEDEFGNVITTDRSKITLVATNDTTAFKTTTVSVSKGLAKFTQAEFNKAGTYILAATDSLNNQETANFVEVINPRATVVSSFKAPLTLSPGQTLTVSASFKANGSGSLPFGGSVTLTGTVGTDNQHVFASGAIKSNGQVTLSAQNFTQGVTDLTLTYSGDGINHTGASRSFTVTDQAGTQTTLSGLANKSIVPEGSMLNLTATTIIDNNTAATAAITGTFTLMDGKNFVTSQTTSNGTTLFQINSETIGKHSYLVVYSGDDNNKTSSSTPAISFTVSA